MPFITKPVSEFPQLDLPELRQIIEESNGFIAGGAFKNFFTGSTPKDYDVFFPSSDAFSQAFVFYDKTPRFKKIRTTRNAFTFKDIDLTTPIDIIDGELATGGFKDVANTLGNFDFTISKFAFHKADDGKEFAVTYHPDFFEHLFTKQVVVDADTEITNPLNAFFRALKYTKYGYNVPPKTQAKILEAVTKLDRRNAAQIEVVLNSYDR